ncbi:hypothetical protein [Janthinobacterium sp. 75]|uniref:hypothetical protein n=1 Tax=Janthinobacterium sp. 75 TaxID=2135628 RepID=UPI00106306C3|nr:hypothetical protein [Janthinobacterium sp. 75]
MAFAWLRNNWFYPLASAVVLGDVSALYVQDWSHPRLLEAAVVFDLVVVLPLLYLWCYRSRGAAAIVRAVCLASLGIWATGHIVPLEHQHVLGSLSWLRTTAMVVLVLIEIRILFNFYKAIFASDKTPEEIAEKLASDVKLPTWLTRLFALEARALRSLAGFVKGFLGRR